MHLNPVKYFNSRYQSPDLGHNELRRLLNLWPAFFLNGIKIESIKSDFSSIAVILKHRKRNNNNHKSIWGGAIFSSIDAFFPIMIKQILLRQGIETIFYTKGAKINLIKKSMTDIRYDFVVSDQEIEKIKSTLNTNKLYLGWHNVKGYNISQECCIEAEVEAYIKLKKIK
jgi:hypothetical protein